MKVVIWALCVIKSQITRIVHNSSKYTWDVKGLNSEWKAFTSHTSIFDFNTCVKQPYKLKFIWYVTATWWFHGMIRDCWQIWLGKDPMFTYKISLFKLRATQWQENLKKNFTIWSWPYCIHLIIHSFINNFIQSPANSSNFLQRNITYIFMYTIIHPSIIQVCIHPFNYLPFVFCWTDFWFICVHILTLYTVMLLVWKLSGTFIL